MRWPCRDHLSRFAFGSRRVSAWFFQSETDAPLLFSFFSTVRPPGYANARWMSRISRQFQCVLGLSTPISKNGLKWSAILIYYDVFLPSPVTFDEYAWCVAFMRDPWKNSPSNFYSFHALISNRKFIPIIFVMLILLLVKYTSDWHFF